MTAGVAGVMTGVIGVIAGIGTIVAFELVTGVARVILFLGGGGNLPTCTEFGLINIATVISTKVFLVFLQIGQ